MVHKEHELQFFCCFSSRESVDKASILKMPPICLQLWLFFIHVKVIRRLFVPAAADVLNIHHVAVGKALRQSRQQESLRAGSG